MTKAERSFDAKRHRGRQECLPVQRRYLELNGAPVFVVRRWGCPVPVSEPMSPIYRDGGGSGISCKAIVHAVAELGVRRLPVEGGAYTVSRFVEEGQLDTCMFRGRRPSSIARFGFALVQDR